MLGEQSFGIYKAIVTDVDCFAQTGKIKTRISAFNGGGVPKDLIDGYDSDAFADVRTRDMLTDIMMPFGGGYDYGMFKLPQINSVGLVAFIDGSKTNPIWLGSTANSIFNISNEIVQSEFPSDRLNGSPAIYYDYSEGKATTNFDDENSFIIKTKKNELPNLKDYETMNWQNNPVENLFVLSSAKASIYHRKNDDSYQEFILSNDEEMDTGSIEMSYVVDEDNFKKVLLNDNIITIKNKTGNTEAKIELNSNGNILIHSFQDNVERANDFSGSRTEASIEISPSKINIETGGSGITMSRNINKDNEGMTIRTSKLQILADDISMGSAGYSFVVSPNSGLNFTLDDGSMLTTANNIRV